MRATWAAHGIVLLVAAAAQGQIRPDVVWMAGGHAAGVNGVVYSPDGQFVASASDDGSVKIWRLSDGRLMSSFSTNTRLIYSTMQFRPGGILLVLGGGIAYFVRISDGAILQQTTFGESVVNGAFSPDGSVLAVCGSITGFEEPVAFIRVSDGTLIDTLQIDQIGGTTDVLYTPDGQNVIVSGTSGIRYWRISDGQSIRNLTDHAGTVNTLDLRADGQVFVSGGDDATIKLRNVSDGSVIRTLKGHTDAVTDVHFSPDATKLVSSSRDRTIRIWDAASGILLRTITGHASAVLAVAWSPSGAEILSGGADMTVRRWNPQNGAAIGMVTQMTDALDSLAVSRAGTVATGGYAGIMEIRSLATGALVRRVTNDAVVLSVALSNDGTFAASTDTNLRVKLWNPATGGLLRTLTGYNGAPYGLAFTPDSTNLLTCDFDGPIHINNAATGAPVRDLPLGGSSLIVSGDGQFVAVPTISLVNLWRIDTGTPVRSLASQSPYLSSVALSPDAEVLATGNTGFVQLWRVSDGALLRTLHGHQDTVNQLAFSQDGRILASASRSSDVTMRLWRVSDGIPLAVFDGELGAGLVGLRYSTDNRFLVYGRQDAAVVVARNPFIAGDVNGDGNVDAADVAAMAGILLGLAAPADEIIRADLNGSGVVDGDDIQAFVTAMIVP